MDMKCLSLAACLQFTVAVWTELTNFKIHKKVCRSVPLLATIIGDQAKTICVARCAHMEHCSGIKFQGMSIDTVSTCKLIGYKTLDAANQQIDIHNAFFKSTFQLCPDGFIQILNSCYKFITDDNNHDGKIHLVRHTQAHAKWTFFTWCNQKMTRTCTNGLKMSIFSINTNSLMHNTTCSTAGIDRIVKFKNQLIPLSELVALLCKDTVELIFNEFIHDYSINVTY